MKYASFFTGIGGFELALDAAGHERVFSCEIDPACNKILKARYGHECEAKDITKLEAKDIPEAGIWVGGFPCQDLSVAGKRGGITSDRSGLVWRLLELAEVRRPRRLLLENVPGLLNSNRGGDFGLLVRRFQELGYVGTYRCLDAQHLGVPQRRRRVFVVASLGRRCELEILFEPEGGQGHPAAREEAGQIASGQLARSVGGVSGGQDFGNNKGTPVNEKANALSLNESEQSYRGDGTDNLVAGTLQSCEKNQGRKTPENDQLVAPALTSRQHKGDFTDPVNDGIIVAPAAATLTSGGNPNSRPPGRRGEDDENLVAHASKETHVKKGRAHFKGDAETWGDGPAPALNAFDHQGDARPTVLVNETTGPAGKGPAPTNGKADPAKKDLVQRPLFIDAWAVRGSSSPNQNPVKTDGKSDALDTTAPGAVAIHADATHGYGGTAKTPSPDAAGNVRLRDPGLGISEDGKQFTLNASQPHAVAMQESKQNGVAEYPTAGSLRANAPGHQPGGSLTRAGMMVRRLTPTECERLQGFPDGWSCLCGVGADCEKRRIPPWLDPSTFKLGGCGHSACGCKCKDSPRYRALGNAVAVPVIRWIADRLRFSEKEA